MAARYKKYFDVCKPIDCKGKSGKHCPPERPRSALNGELLRCGAWVVGLFDDQRRWRELSFKDVHTRTEAIKRLNMLVGDRVRGRLNLPSKATIPTLKAYSERYLELIKGDARENTLMAKRRAINALMPYLGDQRLDKLTPLLIEKYRTERKKSVGAYTINQDVVILKLLLNRAAKESLIDRDICRDIKPLKVEAKRDRVLTDTETHLLLERLQGKDRMMILAALFTGMRLNEVLGLKWTDVDFNNQLLNFVQSKTNKLMAIPISSYLVGELRQYKDKAADRINLFESKAICHRIIHKYSTHFCRIFKGLGISDFTFHNLRHTFASLSCGLGTDIITVQNLLGHSNIAMTSRYSHSQIETKRLAIEKMADHVINQKRTLALASS